MTRTTLLLYGLQRTGTNYLETLLSRRYRVRFVNEQDDRTSPAQKHVRLYPDKRLVPEPQYRNDLAVPDYAAFEAMLDEVPDHIVVISKDPYSWLLSYRRFGERCGWPEPEHHYIDEYNAYYGTWLRLAAETDRIHFVRYLDLLAAPEAVLEDLSARLDLRPRRLSGALSARIRRVPVSGRFDADSMAYYLERRYLDEYDGEALEEVHRRIDPEVVAGLGYQVEARRDG